MMPNARFIAGIAVFLFVYATLLVWAIGRSLHAW